jgi:hypothetical protein
MRAADTLRLAPEELSITQDGLGILVESTGWSPGYGDIANLDARLFSGLPHYCSAGFFLGLPSLGRAGCGFMVVRFLTII